MTFSKAALVLKLSKTKEQALLKVSVSIISKTFEGITLVKINNLYSKLLLDILLIVISTYLFFLP